MFERRDPFNWKIPVMIIAGVVALTGGIYIGVKTNSADAQKVNAKEEIKKEQKVKEVFGLSKDCEIWVHKKNEDGSESDKNPMMVGTVDKSLVEMNEKEIREYLKNKYPEREVEKISKYEIVLSEIQTHKDASRSNKYALEADDDLIGLYKYDDDGNRELVEDTQIHINSLPKSVQEEIQKGVVVDSQEEAYSRLENFGS
ncbi:hypothetical protein [Romboutsia sp. MSSM.1001216sp_RTP31141st1_G3_RTP31141_220114]|uniref:hypothetical protein n=1 Tax=unclassified Romboutsia TaxID=2626894 RepID=UPI0031B5B12F